VPLEYHSLVRILARELARELAANDGCKTYLNLNLAQCAVCTDITAPQAALPY
jgi:hypothetical protein